MVARLRHAVTVEAALAAMISAQAAQTRSTSSTVMLERGYSDEALARFVVEPDAGLALAEVAEGVVAFAAWYRVDASTMKLDKLYVLPQRHHRGIGRALIEHVGGHAARAGCRALTLNVNRGNTQAVRAYEACGFAIRARGDFPIGGGFVMQWCLLR